MKGMIVWFARNGVAANLLMALILLLGVHALMNKIPTEVFPDFQLDMVTVAVPYRGATPGEVEEAVVIRIEESIQDLQGIKRMTSTAAEGAGSVLVEVESGYDAREILDDIKNRVDAINTFPDETLKPIISLAQRRNEVITVVLAGDMGEHDLRLLGEQLRDEIANLPEVTQVRLQGVRPYEISVEVSEQALQQYGLTLSAVARSIGNSSIDLPAGAIKTEGGEILLRTKGQAYVQRDFEEIVLFTRADGTRLTLKDIAVVNDGFEETPLFTRFNGKPCVLIAVSRVGDQNAIELSAAVKDYLVQRRSSLPVGVELSYWGDWAKIVKARLKTLTDNALMGGVLVFFVLTLFLRFSVAVWVCVGIPVSFMGAIALMPHLGVTINIFSLFAFILVLGIVVDDAIVTGENIFTHLRRGENPGDASVTGTLEVAVPVTFGVLTTVVAFLPLTMIEGFRGKIWMQIPLVIIPVLLFSLVESKLILPSHLRHLKVGRTDRSKLNFLARNQRRVADGLERFVITVYEPLLAWASSRRYLTLSMFVGVIVLLFSLVAGGRIMFVYFPRVEDPIARARLVMPEGTPIENTSAHVARMADTADALRAKYVDPKLGKSVVENILSFTGSQQGFGPSGRGGQGGKSNLGEVAVELIGPEERFLEVSTVEVVNEWRRMIGPIAGVQELTFRAEIGRGGDPIDIQLTGPNFDVLETVAEEVKERLAQYPGLFDIADSFQDSKQEIRLKIKPQAELLGLTMTDLARQTREAFFGVEAQRIPRGREDVRVMVRYPESERKSIANLEKMRIRTSTGTEVPFSAVADVSMGQSFTVIRRIDRNRTINVTADADKESVDLNAVKADIATVLPEILANYPGVNFTFEGEAREQAETFGSLFFGTLFLLFAIYALLAIPFRSYVQPLIVMSVIPFGLGGAIAGHLIMGMNLSVMSVFGMLALSGVVVNDSLVLVDYVNRRRSEGMPLLDAVRMAGGARFRAIVLTSLTTFAGLLPLLFEKSTQAQFLIPMAVSLGFGILFATAITLFLVPINYLLLEDWKALVTRYWRWQIGKAPATENEPAQAV